jgi:hypothetical protein
MLNPNKLRARLERDGYELIKETNCELHRRFELWEHKENLLLPTYFVTIVSQTGEEPIARVYREATHDFMDCS